MTERPQASNSLSPHTGSSGFLASVLICAIGGTVAAQDISAQASDRLGQLQYLRACREQEAVIARLDYAIKEKRLQQVWIKMEERSWVKYSANLLKDEDAARDKLARLERYRRASVSFLNGGPAERDSLVKLLRELGLAEGVIAAMQADAPSLDAPYFQPKKYNGIVNPDGTLVDPPERLLADAPDGPASRGFRAFRAVWAKTVDQMRDEQPVTPEDIRRQQQAVEHWKKGATGVLEDWIGNVVKERDRIV